ncbi:hypothetical protein HCC61_24880 [Streptomyces sp. HNM0575]|nr:hypothetical protein [Streptomyces sp. HNM0575]
MPPVQAGVRDRARGCLPTPEGTAGTALYVLAHGGVKAALFACSGNLPDRYASVDERELYGRARELPFTGGLFFLGGLAVCGMPPFGTGLGKAVAEEAAGHTGHWLTAALVLVSAVTGGAVLRAGLRIFAGAGARPYEAGRPREAADAPDGRAHRGRGDHGEERGHGERGGDGPALPPAGCSPRHSGRAWPCWAYEGVRTRRSPNGSSGRCAAYSPGTSATTWPGRSRASHCSRCSPPRARTP